MTETQPIRHIEPTPVAATATEQPIFDVSNDRQRDVLKKLEEGTDAILTSEGFQQYLKLASKFHQYSFQNTILIMVQKPEATMVNSYQRWKSLNRQVQKGEQGIKIFFPMFQKVKDPESGEEDHVLRSFGIGNVFDIGQTDGDPLPRPLDVREHLETDDKATALNLKLSRFLDDQGVRLSSEEMQGHKRGYWHPEKKLIALRKSETVSPFAVGPTRTLVHEAAHFLADHRGQIDRNDAEAVAEGAAYVTLTHFGLDVGDSAFPYIAGWAKNKDVLKRNLGEIQKVGSGLISAIEGVGDPYHDGFGSFADSAAFQAAEDAHLEQEWDDRSSSDSFSDHHFF